jgi:hypothetical protein
VTIDILRAKAALTWPAPAAIVYGALLDGAQLNATANIAGTFAYTPPAGTKLDAGTQTLSAHFTPADPRNYEEAEATVSLEVHRAAPALAWAQPASIVYGVPLDGQQLTATANVAGTFVYTPPAGTVLNAGAGQTLSVHFTPSDARNYDDATVTVTIDVAKANQTLSWTPPAAIVYGTPLSSTQLHATVSVTGPAAAGLLGYTPAAGTVLDAGSHTLTVTALETANYLSATLSVPVVVDRAPLSVRVDAKSKLYGAALPALTGTLTGIVNGDAVTPSYTTAATQGSPAGTYPIAATLLDPANRLANYAVTIVPSTLTILPTPLQVAANPATKQYSDPVPVFGATFSGFVLGEAPAVLSGALSITTTATPLSAPGTYPIAIGGLASSNYAIVYTGSTLTVTPEDARVAVLSPLLVSAAPSGPAPIRLTATVKDISATQNAAGDDWPGDIRNATLTFVDRATNTPLCTATIGLATATDPRIGIGTCTFTTTGSALTIGMRIGGYYVRDAAADDVALTVAPPTADFLTGGGALSDGAKFNVNLQYAKNGPVKGNFAYTFERTENGLVHKYELTAATIDSLSIRRTTNGGQAAIVGSGTLIDVTVPSAPVTVASAAPLIVNATDAGEPSTNDRLSVLLLRQEGGFWMAGQWDGTRVVEQLLAGGNLAVHYAK